jgi:hypothetical protein
VRYVCIKIIKCSEDNFRVEKQGSTWDNGTWANSKLKCRGV